MCSQQQVGSVIVGCGIKQVPRACPECWYTPHMHREFFVFNIFHEPIHVYLTISFHVISCVSHKNLMQDSGLLHMKFSHTYVAHIWCLELDSHTCFNSFYWPILFP